MYMCVFLCVLTPSLRCVQVSIIFKNSSLNPDTFHCSVTLNSLFLCLIFHPNVKFFFPGFVFWSNSFLLSQIPDYSGTESVPSRWSVSVLTKAAISSSQISCLPWNSFQFSPRPQWTDFFFNVALFLPDIATHQSTTDCLCSQLLNSALSPLKYLLQRLLVWRMKSYLEWHCDKVTYKWNWRT